MMAQVFIIGKTLSERWARLKKGIMPYSLQHYYWHFIGPPLLIPVYFQVENVVWALLHRQWMDLFMISTFYIKFAAIYGPLLGVSGTLGFYLLVRMIESHWFVYVSQMNHIPMNIDWDKQMDWPTLQNFATCNVEGNWFNDWFTGHLDYQVEHHLFPTMPRHNYPKANVYVREMFKKHGVIMQTKSLPRAFADIVTSLQEYGNIWKNAYYDL